MKKKIDIGKKKGEEKAKERKSQYLIFFGTEIFGILRTVENMTLMPSGNTRTEMYSEIIWSDCC